MLLVTGITGLTGKFLYEQMRRELPFEETVFLVRESSDISWMKSAGADGFGNLRNGDNVKKVMYGISSVLHLAPRSQLKNVLDACFYHGINRIFYVNRTGVYSKIKTARILISKMNDNFGRAA